MLKLLGFFAVMPFANFKLKVTVLTSAFRFVASMARTEDLSAEDENKKIQSQMCWDFANMASIKGQGFFATQLGCGRDRKFKSMMAKAESSITKELDLIKFLHRIRTHTYVSMATLSGK